MAINLNSFETGLAAGTAITTGNSGGGAGRAFDNVTGTVTYDTTHSHSGSRSAKVDMAAGTTSQVRWIDGADQAGATGYIRFYVWLTAFPSATTNVGYVIDHLNMFLVRARIKTDGTCDLVDGAGSIMGSTVTPVALGQWVRVEVKVVCNATTGSGELRLYNTADSATATETVTAGATFNTGSTRPGQWRFGGNTSAASSDVFWIDDIASSDVDWIGPQRVLNQWTAGVDDQDAEITTFPAPGNWLIAVISAQVSDGSAPLLNLGDVSRNLWMLLASEQAEAHAAHTSAQLQVEVWACPAARYDGWDFLNVYASAMQIIASDIGSVCVNVFEAAGLTGFPAVDSITTGTASAANSITLTPPAPTGGANCFMVAGVVTDIAFGSVTTTGTGWSALTPVVRANPNMGMAVSVREATTAAGVTVALAAGFFQNWAGVLVALKTTGTTPAQPNSNWPASQFQLGLGYDLSTPMSRVKWTDQTKRLLLLDGDRGIQAELGTAQEGPTDLVIDNRDGAYSPRAAGSATANAAGTTTTIKIPDASATNIVKGDFFRLKDSGGALKQFAVFQVTSTSSAAGTTTVTFKRADNGGAALASTASGDMYTGIPIDLYIPYRQLMTWGGKPYLWSSGWLRDLPEVSDGPAYSEVQAVATDALETLTAANPSVLRGEILRRNPTHYWPLDDASASGYASNASGVSTASLTQTSSKYGTGTNTTADFGASTQDVNMGVNGIVTLLGDQGTGWAQSGQTGAEMATKGYALVGSAPDFPSITNGVTLFGVLAITDAQTTTIAGASADPTLFILRNTDPGAGTGQGSVIKVSIARATGLANITVWDRSTHAATTTTATADNLTGDIITWALTFNQSSWSIYDNTGSVSKTGGANLVASFSGIDIGGEADAFFHGRTFPGTHAHVAVFPRILTAAEIQQLRNVAAQGQPQNSSGEPISAYIERKLNTVAWKGSRVLNAAASAVGAETPPSGSIADTVAEAAGYGDGHLFVDAAAQLQYRDRVLAYQQAPRAVLGEDTASGEIPYQPGITPSFNTTFLYNSVQVDNTNSPGAGFGFPTPVQTSIFAAVDETSAKRYGLRAFSRATRFVEDSDAWEMSWWWLARYAYPQQRIETVTIDATAASARWPFVLGVEVGDLLTVNKRPLGAPMIINRVRVLRVQPHLVYGHGGQVEGSVTLTLAASHSPVTVLNDPVLGIVGDTVMGA